MRVTNKIRDKVLEWLANGETGMSSKFMAYTAINKECEYAHPHDPADLLRCLKLIEQIPEMEVLKSKLKGKSKQWDQLLDNWEYLEACIKAELLVGRGDRGPITYKAMKEMGC